MVTVHVSNIYYYQRRIIVDWLLYCIAKPENDNILQRALFVELTSVEMIVQLPVGAIMFMAVIVPMRWLAVNTHVLRHRQWGEKNMGEAINRGDTTQNGQKYFFPN